MHHLNVGVENTSTIIGTEYYFEDDPNSNATTPLVNKIDANGYVIEYEYDDAGRITAVKEGTVIITYEYDAMSL